MSRLILLRHGQSDWNKKKLFTGWVDIGLSEQGIQEALAAGEVLRSCPIDRAYTSTLVRAMMTTFLALSCRERNVTPALFHLEKPYAYPEGVPILPVIAAEALNERHYGDLQGQDKSQVESLYGREQFQKWRRGFDYPPPGGESLEMTASRVLPYFHQEIRPHVERNENVLISAHGNSLRALIMELDKKTPEEIVHVEVPTGEPIFYIFSGGQWTRQFI